MENKSDNILGYIQLETGEKAITMLNDIFLNYTFGQEIYWEALRTMANIFYNSYIEDYQETSIIPIEGQITIKTQFPHYRDFESSIPKEQDFQVDSETAIHYIDIQNDMYPQIPIEVRSIDYFGFSLTRGKGKKHATNMWLLNGTVPKLLKGKIFANYTLMDEADGCSHPNVSNLLYVDLKKLAKTNTQAGELAGVLIGTVTEPADPEVSFILQNLKQSFNDFKMNTEVRNIMTRAEYFEAVGRADGIAKGEAKGEARSKAVLLPLIEEQKAKIAELEAMLAERAVN